MDASYSAIGYYNPLSRARTAYRRVVAQSQNFVEPLKA
jgi:hypothetical protein